MNDNILTGIIGALFGYLGSMLTSWLNRDKNKAETKKTNVDILEKLEKQVEGLIDRNRRVEEERDKERDAKRAELIDIHNQLTTVQEMNSAFINKFEYLQRMITERDTRIRELEAQDTQKSIRIKELEQQDFQKSKRIKELEDLVAQHTKILGKTGQLLARNKE